MSFAQAIVEDWLFEMPVRRGTGNDSFVPLSIAITTNKDEGFVVTEFDKSKNQFMMDTGDILFVWQEVDGVPEIIVELEEFYNGFAVLEVGKMLGSQIDAADFYSDLLDKFKRLIFSGDSISDRGAGIWKKLMNSGRTVHVYDVETATSSKLNDPSEIDDTKYDNDHTRFVLSENSKTGILVWNKFETLRIQSIVFNTTTKELIERWIK